MVFLLPSALKTSMRCCLRSHTHKLPPESRAKPVGFMKAPGSPDSSPNAFRSFPSGENSLTRRSDQSITKMLPLLSAPIFAGAFRLVELRTAVFSKAGVGHVLAVVGCALGARSPVRKAV